MLALGLDIEVDGSMPLGRAHEVADRLEAAIRAEFGAGTEIETHIEPLEPQSVEAEETGQARVDRLQAVLTRLASGIEGLWDIHDVRLRRSERGTVLVAHCRCDPDATVESVHRRVDTLERQIRAEDPQIARILIHAEPRRAPDQTFP
jgi:divalent metal cation (Fe/Co/Zn/Cd) transporter